MKIVKVIISIIMFFSGAILHVVCEIVAIGTARTFLTKGMSNEIETFKAYPGLFILSVLLLIIGALLTFIFCLYNQE